MKKIVFAFTFFIVLTSVNAQKNYEIKINFKNCKDTLAYLAFYQFDKTYIADTCKKVVNGNIIFKGKRLLEKGVYCLISQDKKLYFDFIVDENSQKMQINTDNVNLVETLHSTTSKENDAFFTYIKFMAAKNKEFEGIISKTKGMNKKDSITYFTDNRKVLDENISDYDKIFLEKNKGTYLGDIINLKKEKVATEIPKAANNRPDSLFVYNYYKKHYWDGVNFQDDGMIRTPFFASRLKKYFNNVVAQNPDSVAVEIDRMMVKTKQGTKMNMLLLAYFTGTYENYSIMGFDKVFVHMVDNYFKTGKANDVYDHQTIENVIKRGYILKPLLLGSKAPNLFMIDKAGYDKIAYLGFDKAKTSEELTKIYNENSQMLNQLFVSFYPIQADYLLLVFWDVDCGHCQTEIPKLQKEYNDLIREGKDVKVFSVYTEHDFDKYQKYIADHKLDWINVYDGVHINNLKEKYDVYSTPVIYLLDKDKKIIAKRIGVEQIKNIITDMELEYKKNKK